ncbi:uncharacterized protein isoform X2 [Bombus fervidus]|uniref:uncharacterized protein isoform X2 n=1 Tax=Bombus fervidus TaxID=203811 RepID=UPI003D189C88
MNKVLDSLREKGILTDDIQDKFSNLLPDHAKEKLSSIFHRYQDLDSEGKQQFMAEVVEMFRKKLQSSSSLYSLYYTLFYSQPYTIFIFAVLFIAFILVFFVYKLFKCLSERESKREEKRKNKQMKKKK